MNFLEKLYRLLFICFFTFLFAFSSVNAETASSYANVIDNNNKAFPITYDSTITKNGLDADGNCNVTDVNTYSPSCILFETSTGKVLYAKNARAQMYPASTTKMMTAILTLENCNLDDVATVSHNAVNSIPLSYTTAYLKEGEQLTIRDLLHATLIPSANDASVVLAEHIAGSVESFSSMMNTKATEIGCIGTHFVNPNGIHSTEHYSCAYDLALIGRYAMQNEVFRSIVSTTKYTLPASNIYDKTDRIFNTTNDLLRQNSSSSTNYYYKNCTGIKTGYTDAAKNCIVASAKKDDMELVVCILGADRTEDGLSGRNLDCKALFDYGFEHYSLESICIKNSLVETITIFNGTEETRELSVVAKDEIMALVPSSYSNNLSPIVEIRDNLMAPIAKNDVVGKISYTIDGISYSSDLLANSDVIAFDYTYTLMAMAGIVVALYLIFKITHHNSSGRGRSKGRKRSKSSSKAKHSAKHACRRRDNYMYW